MLGLRSRDGLAWVGPLAAVLTVLGGVVAPVAELPPVVGAVARVLPLGYASDALRTLLGEGVTGALALRTAAVLVLGGAWFGLGLLGWTLARRTVRRTGGADLL
ncbi:ABC transporter permease [Rathayibacter sp. VKM Ac-2857]|uniref:ABC transporter permease n=1 Tax=Rathayibacter sp. VKM Ac-2857 TaxID=2739020 RepID=UPI00156692BB|nr:ABC transporter permease [Rathayibacter sp. VKM Ac-2857]NQX15739.1 ABC transporter permease [Rathayibacter sp. VKM Ac-2857]